MKRRVRHSIPAWQRRPIMQLVTNCCAVACGPRALQGLAPRRQGWLLPHGAGGWWGRRRASCVLLFQGANSMYGLAGQALAGVLPVGGGRRRGLARLAAGLAAGQPRVPAAGRVGRAAGGRPESLLSAAAGVLPHPRAGGAAVARRGGAGLIAGPRGGARPSDHKTSGNQPSPRARLVRNPELAARPQPNTPHLLPARTTPGPPLARSGKTAAASSRPPSSGSPRPNCAARPQP
jgi:hypothetical protein